MDEADLQRLRAEAEARLRKALNEVSGSDGKESRKVTPDEALKILFEDFLGAQTPEFRAAIRRKFCAVVAGSPNKQDTLAIMYGLGLVAGVALQVLDFTKNEEILSFLIEGEPPKA